MGATWVMSKEYLTILTDDFDFNQMKGSIDPQKIGFKITDIARLDEFKDKLVEGLSLLPPLKHEWESARNKFISDVSK